MLFLLVIAEVLEDLMGDIDFDDATEFLDDNSSFSLSSNTPLWWPFPVFSTFLVTLVSDVDMILSLSSIFSLPLELAFMDLLLTSNMLPLFLFLPDNSCDFDVFPDVARVSLKDIFDDAGWLSEVFSFPSKQVLSCIDPPPRLQELVFIIAKLELEF